MYRLVHPDQQAIGDQFNLFCYHYQCLCMYIRESILQFLETYSNAFEKSKGMYKGFYKNILESIKKHYKLEVLTKEKNSTQQ